MKILNDLSEIDGENYILKLGANWCSPCKMIDSILESESITKLASEKNITIYKIDVDNDNFEELLDEYDVSSIPVLLYFKDKKFSCKTVSIQTENQIIDNIKRLYF